MRALALISFAALVGPTFSARTPVSSSAQDSDDPCAAVAGKRFMIPSEMLACQKSFPFNETLRQNIMDNVARVFDFYTFEDFYYDSPAPFEDSTVDIRGEIDRISSTTYEVG
jgi:hypothetical protein